jgi:hypothetical protein
MASRSRSWYSSRAKLFLSLITHIIVKTCGELEAQFHAFSPLDGGKQSAWVADQWASPSANLPDSVLGTAVNWPAVQPEAGAGGCAKQYGAVCATPSCTAHWTAPRSARPQTGEGPPGGRSLGNLCRGSPNVQHKQHFTLCNWQVTQLWLNMKSAVFWDVSPPSSG